VREIENIIRLLRSGQQREAALRCWPLLREYSDNCVLIRTLLGSLRGDPWFGAAKERVKEVVRGSHERYAAGLVSLYEDRPADAVHELDEALGGGLRNASVLCARARAEADATGKSNGYDYARQAYDQQPYLAYARASLAMRAKERGDYTLVLSLATMAPEDRVRAVRFEPFGDSYLADLDAQSLDVLLRQGAVSTALLEVRSRPAVTDDAALLFRRAMVYVASSDFDSADRELAAALSADENVVARAAGEDRRRCVDLSAQRPSSRAATLACVLQEIHAGDPQHALAGLQSLAGYWPEDARILLHLGRVLELLGDVEAAANYYGLLIDRSPIVKRARDALLQSCVAASPPRDVLVALRQLAFGGYNAALLMAADCDKRLARDLAVEILEVDAQNYLALSHLGSVLDPESGEFLPVLKRLADIHPFDFELRRIAARHQLERGVVGDSADRFATLVRDGSCDLRDVLLYGIASLAAAVTAK
jgi:tetratricopeptide (TPR) repeat protein